MKLEELKNLIEKHSTEGEINFDDLNKDINTTFDNLIDKKVAKAKDSSKEEHIAEFIKEQGFENVDQFTASVKNSKASSTELSEKVSRYEAELDKLKASNSQLQAANDEYTYLSKLDGVDPKFKKFVMSEVKGLTNDETDFETARDSYLADNAHYLKDKDSIVTRIPKDKPPTSKANGVAAILAEKHHMKLE